MLATRWVAWPLAVALAVLLFVGGPGATAPRSLGCAWDLGHVLAFGVWSGLLLSTALLARATFLHQCAAILAFCLIAGAATEGVQSLTGGDAAIGDVLRDVLGGVLALVWAAPAWASRPRSMRGAARGTSVVLLLVALWPLAAATSDEWLARTAFPVLADFETPFELGRWEGDAQIAIDRSQAAHGRAALRVELGTSTYSGLALIHFPRNWTGYRYLCLEVLNPSTEELDLLRRLHDGEHDRRGPTFTDRYNTMFRLRPGWNALRIDLADVARAPAGRMMDMQDIRALILFSMELPAARTIFIDYVRLE